MRFMSLLVIITYSSKSSTILHIVSFMLRSDVRIFKSYLYGFKLMS